MPKKIKTNDYYHKLGTLPVADYFEYLENRTLYKHHRKHNWHRTPLAISGGVVLLIGTFGLVIGLKHGSLAPIRVAGMTVHATTSQADIQKSIAHAAKNYKLTINYVDGSQKQYASSETGIDVNVPASAANAKQVINKSFLRGLEWWKPLDIGLKTTTDKKTLDVFLANKATVITEAPLDATLTLGNGVATITPDKVGKGSRIVGASGVIKRSASYLDTHPLKMEPAILPVAIKTSDLESSRTKAQALLDKPVTFSIAGHDVVATQADIAGWLDLNPVPKAKTTDVTVDSGKVLHYINDVARRYISLPRSRLITNTPTGQVVLDPGADGVDVVNKDQTAVDVASKLTHDTQLDIALAVQYTPASTVEAQAYDKWFVADITNKRMYAYEGTNLVRSFLVSAGAPATPTVIGDFAIYRKFASQDMRGNNADGSRYFQPAVPYVNYFFGDYAIHGNYWRPASYFGNINSSHGCIGVTVADGAWIYDWATLGTHVVVHK